MGKLEGTIMLEIEIPVTFHANPGYTQTWDEPGEEPSIEDINFNIEGIKKIIEKEIEKNQAEIDEELLITATEDAQSRKEQHYNF